MKYKISSGWFLIRNKGITFQAWKLSSYSLLTKEHLRLVILEKISTFFSPSYSYSLQRVECYNLRFPIFEINFFCIFPNWAIALDGASRTKASCTIFDISKVLKNKFYLHLLAVTFSTISITFQFSWYISYSFHHFLGRGVRLVIRDGEDLWQWSWLEIRLNVFRRSTIPQKQFITVIWKMNS